MRRWRRRSPPICARTRPSTAAGRSTTTVRSISAAASRPTSRSSWPVTAPTRRTWCAHARRYSSAVAPRAATSSRASRWRCSARCPGAPCPTFPSKSCCCRAGFRSISTRSPTGRAPSWCRCSSCARTSARARNPRERAHPRAVHDAAGARAHYFRLPPDRSGWLGQGVSAARSHLLA